MEDHVYKLRSYLPIEFSDPETNEFIEYLVSAYLENLNTNKFQFSFTAFHMLYMCYIYKCKWFLKTQGNTTIAEALQEFIRQNRGTTFNTLFDLSQISEKTSLEKLLKSLSFHANDVDLCKNLVEVRNKCSHASGKIYFKRQPQVENYILEELDSVNAIEKKLKPLVKNILESFIEKTWNLSWIQSDIKNWIVENYLSYQEIADLLQLKLAFLKSDSNSKESLFKKILYTSIVYEFTSLVDEKGDYFIKSLESLMKGLPAQIDIRKEPSDDAKVRNTQELIEERILPFVAELSDKESSMAQKILNLTS